LITRTSVATRHYQSAMYVPTTILLRVRASKSIDANGLSQQIFPGFSYDKPSGFAGGCELLGIPLSNGRHLGNLGSCRLGSHIRGLTSSRFNSALRHSNCSHGFPVMAIRTQASRRRQKVCRIVVL
jgi:hypothetical protein